MHAAELIAITAIILGIPSLALAWKTIVDCKRLAKQLESLINTAQTQASHLTGIVATNQQQAEHVVKLWQTTEEQARHAEMHSNRMNDVVKELDEISKALTTTSIGDFPDYLPWVTKLIEKSDKKLRIMCNMYGHGSFSKPGQWDKMRFAIGESHRRDVQISVVCADYMLREKLFKWQYPRVFEDWDGTIKEGGALAKLMQDFIPAAHDKQLFDLTKEEFLKLIMDEEEQIKRDVFRHAHWSESSKFLPYYMWIGDAEAVLAFPTHSDDPSVESADASISSAILTKDRNIVNSLIQIFTRIERETLAASSVRKRS